MFSIVWSFALVWIYLCGVLCIIFLGLNFLWEDRKPRKPDKHVSARSDWFSGRSRVILTLHCRLALVTEENELPEELEAPDLDRSTYSSTTFLAYIHRCMRVRYQYSQAWSVINVLLAVKHWSFVLKRFRETFAQQNDTHAFISTCKFNFQTLFITIQAELIILEDCCNI